MKKLSLLLLVVLLPTLLSAQALHQWTGEAKADGDYFAVKIVILENNHFVVLIQSEDAPFAIEGTWENKDENIFNLSVTTESIMGKEEVPIREGRVYLIDDDTAVIVAAGMGMELTRDPSSNKEAEKREE